ncbi:MAG: hypothetical protein M3Y32_13945 [Pseudomonadota bacterium]|nr:hypothetical protein [Pseudomonadota bacterium]
MAAVRNRRPAVDPPDEMARAGSDSPSATLGAVVGINLGFACYAVLQLLPPEQTARASAAMVALRVAGWQGSRYLWRNPWRKPLMGVMVASSLLLFGPAVGIQWRMPSRRTGSP